MDRLQELHDIEEIKQLKARYQRHLDSKEWEKLAEVFSPDARSVYNGGKYSYEGRDAILKFLIEGLGRVEIQSMHHAHTPEIKITSETTATGTWYLEDFVLTSLPSKNAPHGTSLHGTGIYSDEYIKLDGAWRILSTGYERIFEDIQPRNEGARLHTRWDEH
ncbi:MAG: nuclear transport factor 2 family protein [Myxococcota bacterium]|nr:nuclear transport factor 2 family protein [Myxococcota bacterium]